MNYSDIENKKSRLICGAKCIGKTYFSKAHKIPFGCKTVSLNHLSTGLKIISYWLEKKYTRVIILGAPYLTWTERIKERSAKVPGRPVGDWSKCSIDEFKQRYVMLIQNLDDNNIPYILVDSRNDYPILDKSDFLTMVTE